jgi:rSAM/selenodomain-associated transferase 1
MEDPVCRAAIPVCIFAKPPVPGRVKTRLAQAIGTDRAADLAAAMLHDVWSVVTSTSGVTAVLAAAEPGTFNVDVPHDRVWVQEGCDLGSRIEHILQRGLQTAPAAVALGADTPIVTPLLVRAAVEQLASGNAVLGPCDDGGFYLLGLSSCPTGLLAGIPWSCERTCAETQARLTAHGMRTVCASTLFDVDTFADLERLQSDLRNLPPQVAARTRKWLREAQW